MEEVYVDLYFLINACVDLLCMMLTASLLHRFVRRWRAILASAIGGGYAVLALLVGFNGFWILIADLAVAVLMCGIGFAEKKLSFWRFLQTIPVYLLVSALLGGIMTALYTLLNHVRLPLEVLEKDGLSVWTFALLTTVAGFATAKGGHFLGFSAKAKYVLIRVTLFGKECTLRALSDSGNLLQDPLSGKSVVVAERDLLIRMLPPPLRKAVTENDISQWLSDPTYRSRFRLIPIHTASGDTVLPALVPDRIYITDQKNTYPADYLIALAPLGDRAKGFDALISL